MMNMLHSTSSFVRLKHSFLLSSPLYTFNSYLNIRLPTSHSLSYPLISPNPSRTLRFSGGATIPSNQGTDSVIRFEDFVEKDWSFLDIDEKNDDGEHIRKIDKIISAGKIAETSKVLVLIGSEAFVDKVICSSPCQQLFVVHESLLILASIKEKYDKVKCWQGEALNIPERWTSFDVVFLYFLPALPFELDQVLAALAKHCLPGARLVISHPQGRQLVEEQRRQYPDTVVSNLPEILTLQRSAVDHSFEVVEFADQPGFYLAVLRFNVQSDKLDI